MRTPILSLLALALIAPQTAPAHEGHDHGAPAGVLTANKGGAEPTPGATTGSGDLKFKYHPELSELPEQIAGGSSPPTAASRRRPPARSTSV